MSNDEWNGLMAILGAGVITFLAMALSYNGRAWFFEIKYLWHNEREDILVDAATAEEIKEYFLYYLTKVSPDGPFGDDKDPLYVKWVDRLGRTVLTENRWSGLTYYYLNSHWLDLLEKEWPITEAK